MVDAEWDSLGDGERDKKEGQIANVIDSNYPLMSNKCMTYS